MTEINTNPKDAWKATYEIANGMYGHHKKATTMKMKKADGTMAKNDTENAEVFEDHFKKLFISFIFYLKTKLNFSFSVVN